MTWIDNKTGRPVFRLSSDKVWPLPLFTPGQVTPARSEAQVVPLRKTVNK